MLHGRVFEYSRINSQIWTLRTRLVSKGGGLMEMQEGSFVMQLGGLGVPRLGGWHWGACMARVIGPWASKTRSTKGGSSC